MYHCPGCTTSLTVVDGAKRTDAVQSGIYVETWLYHCSGCGQQFEQRRKQQAEPDPSDEWYQIGADGKTLLIHSAANF